MTERRATSKAKKGQGITEEQIVALLREADAGATIDELCSMYGISSGTLAMLRGGNGGPGSSDPARLKHLEEENRRLRALVADLTLSNQALKSAVSKKKW
ncbi:MAG TPA: transposase [Usitatibacter sp.]|nr:transposase [Usitatibacter sp.]